MSERSSRCPGGHRGASPRLTSVVRGMATLVLVVFGLLVDGSTASAATTRTVTSREDSGPGSLRATIAAAASGDTITFGIPGCASSCMVFLTSGEIVIDKDLTILGGASGIWIRNGAGESRPNNRIFRIEPSQTVTIANFTIQDGRVSDPGSGGGGISNAGTLTVWNTTFRRNRATHLGGGIYNTGTLKVFNARFRENDASGGGAVFNGLGTVTVTDSEFEGNQAYMYGGGVQNLSGTVTIVNSAFNQNHATIEGGGVWNHATLSVTSSTFVTNVAPAGGGISNRTGTTIVAHATLANNTGTLGANLHQSAGTLRVRNSIVEHPAGSQTPSCGGQVQLLGLNLSSHASCGVPTASTGLDRFDDFGGLTWTYALLGQSLAVDAVGSADCVDAAGRPLTMDQRGAPRPHGGRCDLGAYEHQTGAPGSVPPRLAVPGDVTIREDTSTGVLFVVAADPDVPYHQANVTVTGASNEPALIPGAGIVVTPLGPGAKGVTVIPAANQHRAGTITLTATDTHGRSTSGQFKVTVLPVNDRPTFTKGPDLTATGDGQAVSRPRWATAISAGPPDESGQVVRFETSVSDPTLFSVAPAVDAGGGLTFTPRSGAAGVATVTVTSRDDGGTANGGIDVSEPRRFKIEVVAPSSPPLAKDDEYTVAVNTPLTVAAPGVLANDTNQEANALTATPVKKPVHGTLTLNPDGSFRYTPSTGYVGLDSFTYTAQNATGQSNAATVRLTIASAPVLSVADATVGEGKANTRTTVSVPVTLSAAASQPVTVQYATVKGTATPDVDYKGASGTLTIAPGQTSGAVLVDVIGDAEPEEDEMFTVTFSNPAGATLKRSIATITITNDD